MPDRPATTPSVTGRFAGAWPAHRARVLAGVFASATLGLAPFYPHAHIYKQLMNIVHGTLTEWIDVFDLFMHGAPWLYLFFALGLFVRDAARAPQGAP
jgi:hypothetical protein